MGTDNLINFDYRLDSDDPQLLPPGIPVNGEVYITSQEEIGFKELYFFLQCEIKGKIYPSKIIVNRLNLDSNNTFIKGHEYRYNFSIQTEDFPSSFSGNYIQIIWALLIEIVLDDDTRSRKRSEFLKRANIKSLFKSFDGKIIQKHPIFVKRIDPKYEIIYFSKTVETKSNLFVVTSIFLLLIVALLYSQNIYGVLSYIAVAIGTISLGYGLYLAASIKLLGNLKLLGETSDTKNFTLKVEVEKNNHKINTVSVFYTVNEEVIDDRGTSTTTYRAKIYTSPSKVLRKPFSKNFQLQLEYPDRDIPLSLKRNNMRIFVQAHLEFEFSNGLLYTVKEEFPMVKIKST